MKLQRLAMLSVHTSPLATPGGKKVGGMNTYVRELARQMATQGVEVDVFTRKTSVDEPFVDERLGDGARLINVTAGGAQPLGPADIYPHLSEFTSRVLAYTMTRNRQYDMIYSHYWLSGWVAYKLNEVWGTPFAQMFHTLGRMKEHLPFSNAPVPDIRINIEREVVSWANQLIVSTPAERKQLARLYNADPSKVVIVPPGVDTQHFRPTDKAAARAKLGLAQERELLLFVGRIEPLKAVDSIIDALRCIQQRQPERLQNVELLVVGGDPTDIFDADMRQLRRMTKKLGLCETVRFLGAKPNHALRDYYAAADLLIVPSDYESFGMVALESMATGTPVVATRVGGLQYLVQHEQTGLLIPPRDVSQLANAIQHLLDNPEIRERYGENAVARAQEFSWSTVATDLIRAFENLRGEKRAVCGV
jgi:D-inositol-3-phosphate glycosyltransferase